MKKKKSEEGDGPQSTHLSSNNVVKNWASIFPVKASKIVPSYSQV